MKWFDDNSPTYPQGAEVCRHPFLDTQSFYGVSRRAAIFAAPDTTPVTPLTPESHCAFCMGRTREATPEKSRTLFKNGTASRIPYPKFAEHEDALFRRQGNLFEIISFEYWNIRYGVDSSPEELRIIDEFLAEADTREYLSEMLRIKYARLLREFPKENLREASRAFFSGFHELLTSGRHFHRGAENKSGLFTSGTCTPEEHRISYEDIALIHEEMIRLNSHIQYISTFQNWLAMAGASFEHWHKQILAADFWGKPLVRERDHFRENPEAYARFALDTAVDNDFVIAENEYALAYVEVGSKSGLITVASKSERLQPHMHRLEEIHGMSDLVQALCACLGPSTPYNEEWFYTPFNAEGFKTPWRVMINLRGSIEAGFENINQYLVSTISQRELADTLRRSLAALPRKAPGIEATHARASHKKSLRYLLNF